MIVYEILLETHPDTYNQQPVMYAALASQKNHMAVYLTTVYTDEDLASWLRSGYRATGKRMDMGKSCLRFKKLENLPVDLVGEVISKVTVEELIAKMEAVESR